MPMPGNVAQGPTLRRISEVTRDPATVNEALALLKSDKPLVEVAKKMFVVRTDRGDLGFHEHSAARASGLEKALESTRNFGPQLLAKTFHPHRPHAGSLLGCSISPSPYKGQVRRG